MRTVIWGTGGVGGYLAAALAQSGIDVGVVTTPRHATAIDTVGMRVERDGTLSSTPIPRIATSTLKAGPADVVVVALKLGQLEAALGDLGALLGPDTIIVTLQNGVAAPAMIAARYPDAHVAPGLVTMVSRIIAPGTVRLIGPTPTVRVARTAEDGHGADTLAAWAKAATGADLTVTVSTDIAHDLWYKFALITTFGGVCALANQPLGVIRDTPDTRALLERSLLEASAVAASQGVTLTDEDRRALMAGFDAADPAATTSMQRDLDARRPSELEHLNGHLVALAKEASIDVPFQEAATAILRLRAR